MAETMPSDSSPDTDRDFDPTADMMVHDYDDEQTLEDEEGMSNSDSGSNELDALQKEGDMPMEDLMAMYGYSGGCAPPAPEPDLQESRASSSEEEILSNQDLTLDKDEIARDLLKDDEDSNKETSVNDLIDSVDMDIPSETHRMLRSANSQDSSEDDSEDLDYQPAADEDWKKTISVGSDYQAQIPANLQKYGDAPAYENEDRLLWDPSKKDLKSVETYLREVQESTLSGSSGMSSIPQGTHIRDDEQALYLLLQCNHNVEEASRRRKMQAVPSTDPMSLWSEEECRNFETGLKMYGKDFYLIQQNKVRTRSVGELVQFYYLWKKTERHDAFTNKNRLEKKKYALHPGVTDYMDRFLDEQDNPSSSSSIPTPNRDRSSSPNINSLIYADPKRQQQQSSTAASSNNTSTSAPTPTTPQMDIPLIVEMVQKVVHPQELDRLSSELVTSATAVTSLPGSTTTALPTFTATPPTSSVATPVKSSSPDLPPQDAASSVVGAERHSSSSNNAVASSNGQPNLTSSPLSSSLSPSPFVKVVSSSAVSSAVSSLIDSVVAIAASQQQVSTATSATQQQQQQCAAASSSLSVPQQSTSPPVAAASD